MWFNITTSRCNTRIKSQLSLDTYVSIRRSRNCNRASHRRIIRSLLKTHSTFHIDTRRTSKRNSTLFLKFQYRIQYRSIFNHLASRHLLRRLTINMIHDQILIDRNSYRILFHNRLTIFNISHYDILIDKLNEDFIRANTHILHIRCFLSSTRVKHQSCNDKKIDKISRHIHIAKNFSRYRINHEVLKLINGCSRIRQRFTSIEIRQHANKRRLRITFCKSVITKFSIIDTVEKQRIRIGISFPNDPFILKLNRRLIKCIIVSTRINDLILDFRSTESLRKTNTIHHQEDKRNFLTEDFSGSIHESFTVKLLSLKFLFIFIRKSHNDSIQNGSIFIFIDNFFRSYIIANHHAIRVMNGLNFRITILSFNGVNFTNKLLSIEDIFYATDLAITHTTSNNVKIQRSILTFIAKHRVTNMNFIFLNAFIRHKNFHQGLRFDIHLLSMTFNKDLIIESDDLNFIWSRLNDRL